MNKFGVVLGIAAVATLAGCKNPDYKRTGVTPAQGEVKNVETTTAVAPAPVAVERPVEVKGEAAPVEKKPVIQADLSKPVETKPAEPEYTIYIVQNGDYLAKISKKFNVTISSIKRLNPSIKKDVVWAGQKLKLPGKVDVGVQESPKAVAPAVKGAKKSFVPYTGATKDYVVKSGDTLGSIAYGNGINIRQLKDLNGLSSDSLKIGQKLKIPAEKVAKAEKAAPVEKTAKKVPAPVETKVAEASPAVPAETAPASDVAAPAEAEAKAAETAPAAPAEAKAVETAAPAAPAEAKAADAAAPATATYVVQEGDDMIGVAIRWGVTAAEVRELNNLAEGDKLVPGQIIKLPADAQQ